MSGYVGARQIGVTHANPPLCPAPTHPDATNAANFPIWRVVTLTDATQRAREDSCAVMRDSFLRAIPVLCHLYFRRAGAMPRVVKLDDPVVLAMRQTNSERD